MPKYSHEDQTWVERQRTHNLWLWGLVALLCVLPLFVVAMLGIGWYVAGETGLVAVAVMLSVLLFIAVAFAVMRALTHMISAHTTRIVQHTTLALMAHQSNDNRGDILRESLRELVQARHDDNQTALAIHRQAERYAKERIEAVQKAHTQPESLSQYNSVFKLDDEEMEP